MNRNRGYKFWGQCSRTDKALIFMGYDGIPTSEKVLTDATAFRRGSILMLRRFEKVHTDATTIRSGSLLTLRRFGEGPYWCYGISERINTHATAFRRRSMLLATAHRRRLTLMLRRFRGQCWCYGVSEKVNTDATAFRRRTIFYGVSERVNIHVTPFRRRSVLMLWRFGEG